MINAQDKELQQYRDLMTVPDRFDSGFGPKMIVAALFLGFLMVPGSIYLSLFTGQSMGAAAQWVTVILFAEVSRRSMKNLKTQEVYLLFYMTGIALAGGAGGLQGGVMSQLLWSQYFVQSPAATGMGIAADIPWWFAPKAEYIEMSGRTFFTTHWLPPIAFMIGMLLIGRIDQFGLGYALYRWTAHVEKLPFPMAPAGALGITALSETQDRTQRWRWRCFSLGGVLGLAFGFIYIGVPAITGAIFKHPIKIIPLPWIDFTRTVSTNDFMPAVPLNLVFDLTFIILGMVLPFWAVVGGFIGLIITWALNPILQRNGMLPTWQPGMGLVDTVFSNTIDFYLSFGIGLALAIFFVSVGPMIIAAIRAKSGAAGTLEQQQTRRDWRTMWAEACTRNRDRGDFSIFVALAIYLCSTTIYILLCMWLMPGTPEMQYRDRFPWVFFLGFAFVYQPIISYTSAKLEGMVGQYVSIPLVREAAYILSGYKGAAIWFAPIPINDYGVSTQRFRVMELTGTRLTDIIKVELLAIPILGLSSLLFCELIWRMAPIPSEAYPYTVEVWDLNARNYALAVTATSEGSSPFLEAIKFDIISWGLGAGLVSFVLLSFLNLPTFLIFGAVRGLNQTVPGVLVFEMIGALIGRYYFEKKFGHQKFKQYVMILFAGFSAGMGLVGMASVAIALIIKSTTNTGY